MELSIAPLWIAFLLRAPRTWRVWLGLGLQPLPMALMALAAWMGIAMLWSPGRSLGLEEIANLRWLMLLLLLMPVLGSRKQLVLALAIGFLVGNIVQLLNAWALHGGPQAFLFGTGRQPDRISGWWDPAVAGTILTAALGLHLPAALMGHGRERLLAGAGIIITLIGVIATGSRGGWVASYGLILVGLGVALWKQRGSLGLRRTLGGVGLGAALLVLLGATVLRPIITERIAEARTSIEHAADGNYDSFTGARILMKGVALDAAKAHPIAGVGTGGFGPWARAEMETTDPDAPTTTKPIPDHAHDTALHLLACNGLVGLGLDTLALGVALFQGIRLARDSGLGSYGAGPLFALIGLVLVMPFDTLYVSGQSAAIFGLVLALCPGWVPKRR